MEINKQIELNINSALSQLQSQFTDISPIMENISALVSGAIDRNFEAKGRWDGNTSNISISSGGSQKWKPLAKSTKAAYEKKGYDLEPTLNRNKNLKSTIEVRPKDKSQIAISVTSPYGAIHQYGGTLKPIIPITVKMRKFFWAKYYETNDNSWKLLALTKNKELKPVIVIPPRPYITLTEEDLQDILDFIIQFLQSK